MADKKQESSSSDSKPPSLHPAYTVSNIQTKIRPLDGTKITYSSWTKLFTLHAKAYKVFNHIDGTTAPTEMDDGYVQWVEIDSLVLQWIYSTLSDEYLVRVLENDTTARAAWLKIQAIFLNNKHSRAAALEQEFSNLSLTSCASMDAYCQKLKDIADQLGDVEQPVSESRLVLQLVRGLPKEFDVVGAFINQSAPTWDTARSMLQLEIHRQSARQQQTHALAATGDRSTQHTSRGSYTQNQPGNISSNGSGSYRGRGQNRGRGRNQRGRGRGSGQTQTNTWPNYWHNNGWTPPPSPYPAHPPNYSHPQPGPWHSSPNPNGSSPVSHPIPTAHYAGPTGNYSPGPNQHPTVGPSGPYTPGPPAQFAGFTDYNPTDLANLMQQAHLSESDPNWYMDTGATSHLTKDPGPQGWNSAVPPQ